METLVQPFTNSQIELLKLFSTNLNEADLRELKDILAQFYAQKSIQAANQVWHEKKLTQQDLDSWLNDPKQ